MPRAQVSVAVLVLDDEAPVRQIERRVLEGDGYRVTEAGGGLEAIEFLSHGTPLELLIADLDMPGLAGTRWWREFEAFDPTSRSCT